jgi:hypothetical protein
MTSAVPRLAETFAPAPTLAETLEEVEIDAGQSGGDAGVRLPQRRGKIYPKR